MSFFDTPDAAEAAFYAAFLSGDLDAMMQVWTESADCCCIHPMSAPIQGHDAIRSGWKNILENGGARLTWRTLARHAGDGLAVHRIEERLLLPQGAEARMHATHVYIHAPESGWKLLLHHASPLPVPKSADKTFTMH